MRRSRNCRSETTRRRFFGGTIINLLCAIIFFGALAYGIWWIIKSFGQAGQQYADVMIQTSKDASALKCQLNMRSIWQCIQTYYNENESLPSSQDELVRYCESSRLFHCDEPNAPTYVYIPGQTFNMPSSNVLLYEPLPVHQGRSTVLFLSGQMDLLSPEVLREAVEATRAQIRVVH